MFFCLTLGTGDCLCCSLGWPIFGNMSYIQVPCMSTRASMLSSNTKHLYGDQLLLIYVALSILMKIADHGGRAGAYALAPPVFYSIYICSYSCFIEGKKDLLSTPDEIRCKNDFHHMLLQSHTFSTFQLPVATSNPIFSV